MEFKHTQFGKYSERIDFSKIKSNFPIPNLIAIQTEPYKWFLNYGIQEVMDEVFPIKRDDGDSIVYLNKWWIEPCKISAHQARRESKNYEFPIYASLTIVTNVRKSQINIEDSQDETTLILNFLSSQTTHAFNVVKHKKDQYFFKTNKIKNQQTEVLVNIEKRSKTEIRFNYTITSTGVVFLADFPQMTEKGTFVINGSEKVIISQFVRSPGPHYKKVFQPKTGEEITFLEIIPSRGTWLEFQGDKKRINRQTQEKRDVIYVRLDKTRRVTLTNFLTALGFKREYLNEILDNPKVLDATYEIDDLVGDFNYDFKYAIQEIYKKIRSGEVATTTGAVNYLYNLLFTDQTYDLTRAGRYKMLQKLLISSQVEGYVLAESLQTPDGKTKLKTGTLLTGAALKKLKDILETGVRDHALACHEAITGPRDVEIINAYKHASYIEQGRDAKIYKFIGIKPNVDNQHLTVADLFAAVAYFLNFYNNIGHVDDIDSLSNRRVRTSGELLKNIMRIGLSRIKKNVREKMVTFKPLMIKPTNIFNNKPLIAVIGEFFKLSRLCQFLDQTNPLSELANKRRITALGPGGLSRERSGLQVRDVHATHYGRLCPIQTPEGPNIGLINNLSTYAKINEYGFIKSPYHRVVKGRVTDKVDYLLADEEARHIIAQANTVLDDKNFIVNNEIAARYNGENLLFKREEIDYMDVSPKQVVSVSAAGIPFIEKDDTSRALMGANMEAQATSLIAPQSPIVATGIEHQIAKGSGLAIVAQEDGVVKYSDAAMIRIKHKKGIANYELDCFERSNQGTPLTHCALVKTGDIVKKGDILADGPSMQNGELALGQNVVVAFTTWRGYNFEDAIVISERLQKEDVFTSLHISEYRIERRKTKQGPEEITAELPNVPEKDLRHLDEDGLVTIGAEVYTGDVLVGKVTPRGHFKLSPEEKLLQAIFGEKSKSVRDTSLRVPNGGHGIVQRIQRLTKADSDLPADVLEVIKVYVVQKRKIQEGDKMAGRHGNKGVISVVLPQADMPFTKDGQPVDILLNPMGVPSRMNIGQVLEMHLGWAGYKINQKFCVPIFESVNDHEWSSIIRAAGMEDHGKQTLYDGQTGEPFKKQISVGVMYMLKLHHMVDDKLHARNIGPYSLITQQPLGGKTQLGGQRFGEMEVWALQAYGAGHTLQEMLTIKSDDMNGRTNTYKSIIWGNEIPLPSIPESIPESFNVLMREIRGLGFNIEILNAQQRAFDQKPQQNVSEFVEYDDLRVTATTPKSHADLEINAAMEALFTPPTSEQEKEAKTKGKNHE